MIKCPNCRAELEYSPGDKEVICKYCYTKFDPEEFIAKESYAKENKDNYMGIGKSYQCSQCGATLMTFDETAVTFCSYCGSQAMIESQMKLENNPEYIIPFAKTREECIANYKKKVRSSFFVSSKMKSDIIVNQFRGIYMPYAIYNFSCHEKISDTGYKYKIRFGDYKYYKVYDITADVNVDYKGLSHDLLSKYSDNFSNRIPFDFKGAKPFNINYLTGYYADTKDVDSNVYYDSFKKMVENDTSKRIGKIWKLRRYGCPNPGVRLKGNRNKVGMFPVYFLSVKNKKSNRINYAVVNGQTGEVAIDLPIDFIRYLIFALVLAIPIFFLVAKLPIIIPLYITLFALVSSIISVIIATKQAEQLYIHENYLDDKGYMSKSEEKTGNDRGIILKLLIYPLIFLFYVLIISAPVICLFLASIVAPIFCYISFINNKKIPIKYSLKYVYKQFIAISISLAVLLFNPVKDVYYYGAAIISLALVVFSFYSLISERNLIISRKLPQLEKRGGDENV